MEAPELARIRRAYGPTDLAPLLRANGIDATILVRTLSGLIVFPLPFRDKVARSAG